MHATACMDCGGPAGVSEIAGSTGICDGCLERRYPAGAEESSPGLSKGLQSSARMP